MGAALSIWVVWYACKNHADGRVYLDDVQSAFGNSDFTISC